MPDIDNAKLLEHLEARIALLHSPVASTGSTDRAAELADLVRNIHLGAFDVEPQNVDDGRVDFVAEPADPVNHPPHYRTPSGAEVIDIIEHLPMCRGNAVKYLVRAGVKDPSRLQQDLEKARWYVDREIARVAR